MIKLTFVIGLSVALSGCSGVDVPAAEDRPPADFPTAVVAPGQELTLAASIVFTEGPAADAEGNVYFSEITGNRILKYLPNGGWTVFREPSRRANGLAFDADGRLLACEGARVGGGRQVTRTDLVTGEVEVLADSYEGKKLNSPNDLVVAKNGRIYFTDPRYGGQDGRELETEDVYLIDTDGSVRRVATKPEIAKPNGVSLSPDQKTLYVADTQAGPPREARVMKFDIREDGGLENPRVHYSFGGGRGIDGMAVDTGGNIYGAAGNNNNPPENHAGIYVISPQGQLVGRIPVPEDAVTNCTFGGPELKTLYVTAGKQLYAIRMQNSGLLAYPPL